MLRYCINPPKLGAEGEVYYKDIVVFVIDENDKVVGARLYDYNYKSKPIATLDVHYHPAGSDINFLSVKNDVSNYNLIDNSIRTTWIFNDETEAVVQKIICLKHIRDEFLKFEKNRYEKFNSKIPKSIYEAYENTKNKNPEYFL